MTTQTGTIVGFYGSWGSGLASLALVDEAELLHHIPCENGPTVRALRDAFGGEIIGQEIVCQIDDRGLLESFEPAQEVRS